jgi:hypothetical protein
MFGDPFNGQPFSKLSADNFKTICHAGDAVCKGTAQIPQNTSTIETTSLLRRRLLLGR